MKAHTADEQNRTLSLSKPALLSLKVLAAASVVLAVNGCAGFKSYFTDRANDAADIFTIAGGRGVGVGMRVSVVPVGLYIGQDRIGLRGGQLLNPTNYPHWRENSDCYFVTWCEYVDEFDPFSGVNDRGKGMADVWHCEYPLPLAYEVDRLRNDPRTCLHPYYTDITVKAGVYPGIDLGFNPGELVDFLLGWATVDIFDDDLGRRQASRELDKPVEANTAANAVQQLPQGNTTKNQH